MFQLRGSKFLPLIGTSLDASSSRDDKMPKVRTFFNSSKLPSSVRNAVQQYRRRIGLGLKVDVQLLTIGASFLIFVVAILLVANPNHRPWDLFVPVILVLLGVWMLALAAMPRLKPAEVRTQLLHDSHHGVAAGCSCGAWYLFSL